MGRSADVERVPPAVEQPVWIDLARVARIALDALDREGRIGEGVEHRLRRGVHRASLSFVAPPARERRLERVTGTHRLQQAGDLSDLLLVHPPHHLRHPPARPGRGEQERRQELGRGRVPEVGVGQPGPLALASRGAQALGHAAGTEPGRAGRQG